MIKIISVVSSIRLLLRIIGVYFFNFFFCCFWLFRGLSRVFIELFVFG